MKTTTSTAVYSLNYRESKTYAAAALFVVGNILLPQLCHLMPQGGLVWLPIYFFTLVAAYKLYACCGLQVRPYGRSAYGSRFAVSQQSALRNAGCCRAACNPYQVGIARFGGGFHSFKGSPRGFLGCRFGRCGLSGNRNAGGVGHDRLAHGRPSRRPLGLAGHPDASIRRIRRHENI